MEAIISKSTSDIANEAIVNFKQIRRKHKMEKADAEMQSKANFKRAIGMALIMGGLFAVWVIQRMFF